jgi:predicted RNase H-like HicB family nuclease
MTEIIFLVEESQDGGYTARALGEGIFTQAETLPELKEMIKDAVHCHFEDAATAPKIAHLHLTKEEVFAL